jgi:hypothetical protein
MKATNKILTVIGAAAVFAGTSASAQTLIDQWNFNETSGTTAANSVGGGASATLMGGATFNGSGSVALVNIVGSPGSQYIDLGNALNGLTSVTMECWFNYTQNSDRNPLITALGSSANYYLRYNLYDSSYQAPNAYAEANNSWGGGGNTLAESGAPAQNSLQNVTIVYDSANSQEAIYLNGVSVASHSGTLLGLNSIGGSDLELGRSAFTSDTGLNGTIDQFSIYNGALSGSQITANFAAGPAPVPEPSTCAMLAGGFGMLLAGFRMRKNK